MTSGKATVAAVQEGQADVKPKAAPNAEQNMATAKYSQQVCARCLPLPADWAFALGIE